MSHFIDLVQRLRDHGRTALADKLSAFFSKHHAHRGVEVSQSSSEYSTYRMYCEQCNERDSIVEDQSLRRS